MGNQSRRGFLVATGSVAAITLAGCLGGDNAEPGEQASGQPLTSLTVGQPDSVSVIAFEDIACGGCQSYHAEVLPELRERYIVGDEATIEYTYAEYPVPVDGNVTWEAANAVRGVHDQLLDEEAEVVANERTFEYLSEVYQVATDGEAEPDVYAEIAEETVPTADTEQLREAISEQAYHLTIEDNQELGEDFGVSQTPSVVVDGELVEMDSPTDFESIQQAITAAQN